jgi:hypothetical protein
MTPLPYTTIPGVWLERPRRVYLQVSDDIATLRFDCSVNIQFIGENPHVFGMTRGDKMFMEGCENAFPSNKDQESSKSMDRDSSDQEEIEDDRE